MKKITLLLLCIYGVSQAGAQTGASPVKPKDSIDTVIAREARVFLQSKAAVGVSVGFYHNGRLYTYNYGSVSKDAQHLPTAHTIYGIGSISKTFAGLLLAKAVTENKVKLDDDIRKYLDGDYPNLEYKGHPIKLFHLISHVSRLPNWLSDQAEKPGYTRDDFYRDLHQLKIDTLPGVKFLYSSAAVQLLGYILEKVYHQTFGELLREKITGPLQMKDTRIVLTARDREHAAKGYTKVGMFDPNEYNYMQGAGGLKSTASDLLKYMVYQMNEEDPAVILSHKESWGFDMGGGNHYSCALNWQVIKVASGPRRISQDGNLVNCSGVVTFSPELKTGIVVLTNSDNIDAVSKCSDDILKALAPAMY
ncbi:serine hydrolase domain-containing protein [Mucilaginibacter dorajii]|uniref:Beta-lactamase-related domain-containing protein n=1 Tax=Mucilaginibacter dorajii TaxID=692994 RepID=A0ABP7R3H9_9SPHI|nr:serine hydrolase domain-containing protein [Mucilaginibacter dorajii]MCS3738057.1 CubicO group peptidase (beta-lactamase class C family) [Mucilaginibacter dorajii]